MSLENKESYMKLDGKITCINVKKHGLSYIPIPKNCSSSIKHYLYEMIHGKKFRNRKKPNGKLFYVHNYFNKSNKKNPHRESYFNPHGPEKSFVVIREPIKRYISGFANRVVNHGALGENVDLTLDEFTTDFETYLKKNIELEHHMSPQTMWIGSDLSIYDWQFTTDEIAKMNKTISDYTNTDIEFPHKQTGGPKLKLDDLSKTNFYRLVDYYYEDYRAMRDYFSIDSIVTEYRKMVDHG